MEVPSEASIEARVVHGTPSPEQIDVLRGHGLIGYTNRTRPPKFLFFVDYEMADAVRKIPFSKYKRGPKCWELPVCYESLRLVVKTWPNVHFSETAYKVAKQQWKAGKQENELLRYLRDLKSGKLDCSDIVGSTDLQPRDYQQIAVKFIERAWAMGYGVGNFDEQGLGKTCTILFAIDRFLADHPDAKAVVFAPKSLLHSVWVAEIVKFTTRIKPLALFGSTKKRARMLTHSSVYDWTRSTTVDGVRRTEFIKVVGEPNLFLVNHEAGGRVIKTHSGRRLNELFQALVEMAPEFCIVDEVHKISNTAANRSKSINAVARKAKFVHGMTGTPGLPLNLYGILSYLDPRIYPVNKTDFERRYVDAIDATGERQFKIVKGYKRLEELERRSSQFSIRRTQADCPDIPKSVGSRIYVEMSKEQIDAYDATASKILAFYEEHNITKVNLPAQLHALRNITCGHIKDAHGKHVHFKKNGKLQALMDLLEDEILKGADDPLARSGPRKAVIACAYREDVELVSKALTKVKHVVIHGGIVDTPTDMARTNAASAFVEDPEVKVLVGITSTFGVGLNLVPRLPQICDLMVFYSNGYDPKERDQAEKRIQRSGQTRMCRFVDLVCENTIDETILEIVDSKKQIQDIITGDNLRFALRRGH